MRKRISLWVICWSLMLLSACGSSPKIRYYTLEDAPPVSVAGSSPSVLVLAASVSEGLDRPLLVLRGSANQVLLSEQLRWAEPLRSSVPRVLASDLQGLLGSAGVVALSPGGAYFDADFRLNLHVQRLDAQPGRGVDLELQWVLKPRQGKEILGRSQVFEPDNGDGSVAALVAAQRRALGRAAGEIAVAIRRREALLTVGVEAGK